MRKEIVCRGFDKFFNYSELYADDIDWKTARVQEKIDGSIVKMYRYGNIWHWATNRTIDVEDALLPPGFPVRSFMDIIRMTPEYETLTKIADTLDGECTYIFELTSPYNRIIIPYRTPALFHIGTRNNRTGIESPCLLPVRRPKEYALRTLNDCMKAAAELNTESGDVEHEGFVVVDGRFKRVKIKSPEYVYIHRAVNNHVLTKKRVLDLLLDEDFNADAFLMKFPEYADVFRYYQGHLSRAKENVRAAIRLARKTYQKTPDRQITWKTLQDAGMEKYARPAMRSIENDIAEEALMTEIDAQKWVKMLKDVPDISESTEK